MNDLQCTRLTHNQFDVLVAFNDDKNTHTANDIANTIEMDLAIASKVVAELFSLGYVQEGQITAKGELILDEYKVKRAVYIAAGFGSRLIPITLNTPKPLIRVHGKKMIETSLDAIICAGITEIYIVRGYLAEEFDQLLHKYPMITFIENSLFNDANSIMSAVYARQFFRNAYVLDGDLILNNPNVITRYQYSSNYLGVPVKRTDDWCFQTRDGIIEGMTLGGTECHKWIGISYWTEQDGKQLEKDLLKRIEQPGGKQVFWDEVPIVSFKDNYKLSIRGCGEGDVVEIDTFSELKAIDKIYDV